MNNDRSISYIYYRGFYVRQSELYLSTTYVTTTLVGCLVNDKKYKSNNKEKYEEYTGAGIVLSDPKNKFFVLGQVNPDKLSTTESILIKNELKKYIKNDDTILLYSLGKPDVSAPIFKNFNNMKDELMKFMDKVEIAKGVYNIEPVPPKADEHIIITKSFDPEYFKSGNTYEIILIDHPKYKKWMSGILTKYDKQQLVFYVYEIDSEVGGFTHKDTLELSIEDVEKYNIKFLRYLSQTGVYDTLNKVHDYVNSSIKDLIGEESRISLRICHEKSDEDE